MIPQETVNLILDTARIEEVVSDFVTLKRRGASYVACCPFHNEKTPSFYVTPAKGIFKCFGCGKAGSAVSFVMEHEHSTYVEALRYLARKYHEPVHRAPPLYHILLVGIPGEDTVAVGQQESVDAQVATHGKNTVVFA